LVTFWGEGKAKVIKGWDYLPKGIKPFFKFPPFREPLFLRGRLGKRVFKGF